MIAVPVEFQSTPSARRATDTTIAQEVQKEISIHALREESDGHVKLVDHDSGVISIHALREESDLWPGLSEFWQLYFNPRPPRGGRQIAEAKTAADKAFQSTPSARRATVNDRTLQFVGHISIHALREESDAARNALNSLSLVFQSTPSARRATAAMDGGVFIE